MQSRELPSFFFTKRTGAPQGDTLGLINCLSIRSSICSLSSTNSAGDIRYGWTEMGAAVDTKSIVNSTSRIRGSPGISSGKTSGNSSITSSSTQLITGRSFPADTFKLFI
ncbi:hypothetical protein VIGAN_07226600 [Vigna angularis var. angularis]|uniref:Uncharacterized protein n=1 Tax=Vigna angularis var. angularis TaxID=157739 RepID=A0A0S3SKJ0_PHAAN|nr:hypothetical protein VIGAN_07226600 [Vigna angularis var. angularis]